MMSFGTISSIFDKLKHQTMTMSIYNSINNIRDIDKERHELEGSLGVFRLLCRHIMSQDTVDDRTLGILDLLVALLERVCGLKGEKGKCMYKITTKVFM